MVGGRRRVVFAADVGVGRAGALASAVRVGGCGDLEALLAVTVWWWLVVSAALLVGAVAWVLIWDAIEIGF